MLKRKIAIGVVLATCVMLGFLVVLRTGHLMPKRADRRLQLGMTPFRLMQASAQDTLRARAAVRTQVDQYRRGRFTGSMTFQYDMYSPPHVYAGDALRKAVDTYYPMLGLCRQLAFGPTFLSGAQQLIVVVILCGPAGRVGEATFVVERNGSRFKPTFVYGYQDGRGDRNPADGREPGDVGPFVPYVPPQFQRYVNHPRMYPPPSPILALGSIYAPPVPFAQLIGSRLRARHFPDKVVVLPSQPAPARNAVKGP